MCILYSGAPRSEATRTANEGTWNLEPPGKGNGIGNAATRPTQVRSSAVLRSDCNITRERDCREVRALSTDPRPDAVFRFLRTEVRTAKVRGTVNARTEREVGTLSRTRRFIRTSVVASCAVWRRIAYVRCAAATERKEPSSEDAHAGWSAAHCTHTVPRVPRRATPARPRRERRRPGLTRRSAPDRCRVSPMRYGRSASRSMLSRDRSRDKCRVQKRSPHEMQQFEFSSSG